MRSSLSFESDCFRCGKHYSWHSNFNIWTLLVGLFCHQINCHLSTVHLIGGISYRKSQLHNGCNHNRASWNYWGNCTFQSGRRCGRDSGGDLCVTYQRDIALQHQTATLQIGQLPSFPQVHLNYIISILEFYFHFLSLISIKRRRYQYVATFHSSFMPHYFAHITYQWIICWLKQWTCHRIYSALNSVSLYLITPVIHQCDLRWICNKILITLWCLCMPVHSSIIACSSLQT